MDGMINLDKPPGISSAAAVARVKRLLPRGTKIGHAGTLDPFATGVLVLLIGKSTKLCEMLMDQPKQYEATIKFGATTATDDPTSAEVRWSGSPGGLGVPPERLSEAAEPQLPGRGIQATIQQVRSTLDRFTGAIQQTPPAFSALKIGGRRAYDLARRGNEVKLQPRTVQVYGIDVIDYQWPLLTLRIDCGRGTYIRAMARDLGAALDVGGYLTQLRRTRVGDFNSDGAVTLDRLATDGVEAHLRANPQPKPPH
jgi:tRNA pseudouridine55 synthase